jgi:hypothetical protein
VGSISARIRTEMAVFFSSNSPSTPFRLEVKSLTLVERATPLFFFRIRDRASPGREKVERPKYLFFFSRAVVRTLLVRGLGETDKICSVSRKNGAHRVGAYFAQPVLCVHGVYISKTICHCILLRMATKLSGPLPMKPIILASIHALAANS